MPTLEYRCPGEGKPISQSVHLGRMARFYPGCRECPHRHDTATLCDRLVRRWHEVDARPQEPPLWGREGTSGLSSNGLTPPATRRLAAALGIFLRQSCDRPQVILGGDGRAATGSLVAAAGEGLRWAGCELIDVGPASAPCLASAIAELAADGGLLIGRPDARPHTVGLKFWAAGDRPLSQGEQLRQIGRIYESQIDRPARAYGPLRRYPADRAYLARLAPEYHALRPLLFVLDQTCAPVAGYLKALTRQVACQISPCRAPGQLAGQVVDEGAHFGILVADDGETLRLVDERGGEAPPERMLLWLARAVVMEGQGGRPTIVVEEGTADAAARQIESLGATAVVSGPLRAAVDAAMRQHGALLAGGPSGRFWHSVDGRPRADALWAVTRLLVLLSRSDRPLSAVLDDEAAVS